MQARTLEELPKVVIANIRIVIRAERMTERMDVGRLATHRLDCAGLLFSFMYMFDGARKCQVKSRKMDCSVAHRQLYMEILQTT